MRVVHLLVGAFVTLPIDQVIPVLADTTLRTVDLVPATNINTPLLIGVVGASIGALLAAPINDVEAWFAVAAAALIVAVGATERPAGTNLEIVILRDSALGAFAIDDVESIDADASLPVKYLVGLALGNAQAIGAQLKSCSAVNGDAAAISLVGPWGAVRSAEPIEKEGEARAGSAVHH